VRECIADKKIVLYHVPTEDNTADIFTKNLGHLKFEKFKQQLGIEFCYDFDTKLVLIVK
jgi:hypothetical protein